MNIFIYKVMVKDSEKEFHIDDIISENFIKSSKALLKNWNLILPVLFYGIIMAIAILFIAWLNLDLIKIANSTISIPADEGATLLRNYFSNSGELIKFILSSLLLFLFSLGFGIIAQAIEYNMIRQVLANKKPSLVSAYKERNGYIWRIFKIKILIFLLIFFGIVFSLVIIGLFRLLFSNDIAYTILLVIAGMVVVFVALYVKLHLLFIYPALFLGKEKVIGSFKDSLRFFKNNKWYACLVFLIMAACSIIILAINQIFSIFSYIPLLTSKIWLFVIVTIIVSIIRQLIKLVVSVWKDVFLFYSYKTPLSGR